MAFGSELGGVINSEVACPRCGAPAVIRGRRKESSGRVIMHLTCEKCHLIRYHGFMKVESLMMERLTKTLIKRREKARTEQDRQRVDRKIRELEERRRFKDVGL